MTNSWRVEVTEPPGALIEYAVILFKKQKEHKEPKKGSEETASNGNWIQGGLVD